MKKKVTFKRVYLIYLAVLVVVALATIIYVNVLLHKYEKLRPEVQVEEAIERLCEAAADGSFWTKYAMPRVQAGKFEKDSSIQKNYLDLYVRDALKYSVKGGMHAEDEMIYVVKADNKELAEIVLKATGPAETKLAVFSFREWEIQHVTPYFEAMDYTISVPIDFKVLLNGKQLKEEDVRKKDAYEVTYVAESVYEEPDIQISDALGRDVNFKIQKGQVIAEFYIYSLILPTALTVEVNGSEYTGVDAGENRIRYDIYEVNKPEVIIKDYYDNILVYEGGDELPLTFATIITDSRYSVKVADWEIPERAIVRDENKDFAPLKDYVKNLPDICTYNIAILEEAAEIKVWNQNGEPVVLAEGKAEYDLRFDVKGAESVPREIAEEVDLLQIAHDWSLFMSNDKPFAEISKYMIKDSYQYQMARKYATGADITYTSEHRLGTPPFTDDMVTNFQWITDDCFSVDISFVKHMILVVGTRIDDPMNDRFYFVKYDETNDGKDNPIWKMVSMKEIVNSDK